MKLSNSIVLGIEELKDMVNKKLAHIENIEEVEVSIMNAYDCSNVVAIICLEVEDKEFMKQVCLILANDDNIDNFCDGLNVLRIFDNHLGNGLFRNHKCSKVFVDKETLEVCFVLED